MTVRRPSPFRIVLFLAGAVLLLLSLLFTRVPRLSAGLLSLVHTNEPEWCVLYENLADHLSVALFSLGISLSACGIVYEWLKRSIARVLTLPPRSFLLLLLLLALGTRVVWLLLFHPLPWADAIWYDQLARNLADGKGYRWPDGTATAFLPIGYPALLGFVYRLFGPSIAGGQIVNLLLGTGIVLASYLLARRIWGETAGRLSGLLLACSISQIAFVGLLFSEIVFTFVILLVMLLGIECLERRLVWMMFLFGVAAGVAALIRPLACAVPAAFIATLVWQRLRAREIVRSSALILCGLLLAVTPNIVRNYGLFGAVIPFSTNGGINFLVGNNPHASGYYTAPREIPLGGNESEQSRQAYSLGLQWIGSHPLDAVLGTGKKLFHLYHRSDFGILFSMVRTESSPPWTLGLCSMILADSTYVLLLTFAIAAVFRRGRKLVLTEYFCIFWWIFATGFYLIYFGSHRFHFPWIPVITGFAASFICDLLPSKLEMRGPDTTP